MNTQRMTSTLKFIMDNKYCVSWASAVVGREMYGHVPRAGLCGLGALCLREVSPSRGIIPFSLIKGISRICYFDGLPNLQESVLAYPSFHASIFCRFGGVLVTEAAA